MSVFGLVVVPTRIVDFGEVRGLVVERLSSSIPTQLGVWTEIGFKVV